MKKCLAFIDLLGFTSFVENFSENSNALSNLFNRINSISTIMFYSNSLNETISSFDLFLPTSDSIFMTANTENANLFIGQLSFFLINCFNINSHGFGVKKENQLEQKMIKQTYKAGGRISEEGFTEVRLPLVFRGGVSCDEVQAIKSNAIINGKFEKKDNIFGQAVIDAVKLERAVKGPKVFIES